MTRTPLIIALAASTALAACKEETIVAGPPGSDPANTVATPVELPPSIAASKIYRCSGDNSVVYVDWLSDNRTANVRTEERGSRTQVKTAAEGQPLTGAGGLSIAGTAAASSIQVTLPGGAAKTCHV